MNKSEGQGWVDQGGPGVRGSRPEFIWSEGGQGRVNRVGQRVEGNKGGEGLICSEIGWLEWGEIVQGVAE